ncbi:cell division protein [Actinotignum urinale]|uniref:Cell division protein n=1 Tax=Actinotignum urinale TaxID=190146 RepID=A0ABU5G8V0_9ACTO|nr:cell division protein [Actinotignum urinale]MDY5133607.1 cell division protein [Actinotignum urinale]
MSELHIELTEMLEAGVDLWNRAEAFGYACEHDFELAATCINDYPDDYLGFIASWFDQEVTA